MDRNIKDIYCFLYDDNKHFYRAETNYSGSWNVTHDSRMYPINYNPKNLIEAPVELSTNKQYFSMARSINYPLEFIMDGAAILNHKYLTGKGINENMYLAIFEFDSNSGTYKLSYNGRVDFEQKRRNEKLSTFTVPLVDDSAWGILSQNDDTTFSIDCSSNNPNAIKVLFDSVTLKNIYTFQTVNSQVLFYNNPNFSDKGTCFSSIILANQDGDSYGIVTKNQTPDYTNNYNAYITDSKNYFFYTYYDAQIKSIYGSIKFSAKCIESNRPPIRIKIFMATNKLTEFIIFDSQYQGGLIQNKIYEIPFKFDLINIDADERIFYVVQGFQTVPNDGQTIIDFQVSNIQVELYTKTDSSIHYGLRPLDLVKSIVRKSTYDRYTIESNFFEENNKSIIFPAETFRGVQNPKIYTSFRDFFETFSALFFMALKVSNGSLFMELADVVYNKDNEIIDIGEIIDIETSPASEFFVSEIEVGNRDQDYRHSSGRLEYNSTNIFSLKFPNIKNKMSVITKYRTDHLGIIFLMLDYKGGSTKDNKGDKESFVVDITDEIGSASEDIETFDNITFNNSPLSPIIKYPLTGSIINNNKPFIKGVGIPGSNVNVFIEDNLDGSTIVDADGNWSYNIQTALQSYEPNVNDGVNVINVSNAGITGAIDTIQLIIDTTVQSPLGLTYPRINDSLYNNIPLVKGVAPVGTNINIFLNNTLVYSVVADNSCGFEYKFLTPIPNGNNTIRINLEPEIPFYVNSNVEYPLITYVSSEIDGFPVVNNLPLIKGVAMPGSIVKLYLDYITYAELGNAIADVNGNWSCQVIPVSYLDPISNMPVVMAPIKNGLNVISTSLQNNSVKINVSGYKLNRPAFSSITGVIDNTCFNVNYSPKRMLMNRKSMLSAISNMQRQIPISFEKSSKNSQLRTVLGNEVIEESADIMPYSLGNPIAILEYANMKVVARHRFAEILYEFNQGKVIKANFRGNDLFFLPIGSMKMLSIVDDVQDWKLLFSPKTTYSQLLNLYKTGLTINIMENAIFHSDSNMLHFVEYGKETPDKYNFKSIYDDWFNNRNSAWKSNPFYAQKVQTTEDNVIDQIIVNKVSNVTLRVYKCFDATLVDTIQYEPATPTPIPLPEVVLNAKIDFSAYEPDNLYFFVMMVDEKMVAISERVHLKTKWSNTILIESYNSVNKPGVFYSTGFKSIVRVEGLVKKLHPSAEVNTAIEESGDSTLLYGNIMKKRMIRFGTAQGIPDYLSIKIANALVNDNCVIEGTLYTLQDGEKINPSDDFDGVPMHYYEVVMYLKENTKGRVFAASNNNSDKTGVVLVVDASAIGLPTNTIINIEEK